METYQAGMIDGFTKEILSFIPRSNLLLVLDLLACRGPRNQRNLKKYFEESRKLPAPYNDELGCPLASHMAPGPLKLSAWNDEQGSQALFLRELCVY